MAITPLTLKAANVTNPRGLSQYLNIGQTMNVGDHYFVGAILVIAPVSITNIFR